MNINETHISLLSQAFKDDPMFVYFIANKHDKEQKINTIYR